MREALPDELVEYRDRPGTTPRVKAFAEGKATPPWVTETIDRAFV
jgi:hypothetical protein